MEAAMRVVEHLRLRDVAPVDLSIDLGVSTRTLRKYVITANDLMMGIAHIELRRGGCYHLAVFDEAALDVLMDRDSTPHPAVPETTEGRVSYILGDVLCRTDWVTIDDIARALWVSRNTVTRCLADVDARLARYGLELERRPRYGMCVRGDEDKRRLCFMELVMGDLYCSDGASDCGSPARKGALECVRGMLDDVRECVVSAFENEGGGASLAQIDTLQNLFVHISVAVLRIRAKACIPWREEDLADIQQLPSYDLARAIARNVSAAFDIEVPDSEVAYIAIHLATRQRPGDDGANVISDEVWKTVSLMLERVWEAYRIDFRRDVELRMNLACHVVPLSMRLKFNLVQKNPLLDDIKKKFPLAYSMAQDASGILQEAYESEVSEEEVGYIALAFALAIERNNTKIPRKRVLVVCASGAGTARLLVYRLCREFGLDEGDVRTCDMVSAAHIDFSQVDYVFTTVPLGFDPPVPVRQIGSLFDEVGVPASVRPAPLAPRESGSLAYFDERLFFAHLSFSTKCEVLDFLITQMERAGMVPGEFRSLVWERESLASTSLGNDVALPHPARVVGDETCVAVGLLDEAVDWDGRPVRAVFLSSVARGSKSENAEFYRGLSSIVMERSSIGELLERQDMATLRRLVAVALEREENLWSEW